MTENQINQISTFINETEDEIVDKMFEELVGVMAIYFAIFLFGEEIENKFDKFKNENKTAEEIAIEVKKIEIGEEEIYASLMSVLQEEKDAEIFASNCVISDSFKIDYPNEILIKLEELGIELNDFSINLIVTFKDQFIDFFVNDLDVIEWKNDTIDTLVASWE